MESTCTCGSRNDLRDTSDLAGNRHHPPGIGAPGHAQSTQTVGPPVAAASRLRCCTRKHEAQVRQRRPTRPHSQSDGQPRAGPPGQRQPDGRQRCLQASRAARPTPVSARRTCTRCSRRGRRRTGAPATTPAPAALRRADPPDDADNGKCTRVDTRPHRRSGTATRALVDARRSPPLRHSRCRRSPPATDAEAEPGNSTHQPQPESTTPSRPASRKVRQNHSPRPTTLRVHAVMVGVHDVPADRGRLEVSVLISRGCSGRRTRASPGLSDCQIRPGCSGPWVGSDSAAAAW